MMWWRVTRPDESRHFLVLVVAGRIAVMGPGATSFLFVEIGDHWNTARPLLEDSGFSCVMVPS